jgi:prophage regulatory protein
MPDSDVLQIAAAVALHDDEFWSLKVVKTKTGLSRSTVYAYIAAGSFPMQRRLGRRRVAWLASEVRAWIMSRPANQPKLRENS